MLRGKHNQCERHHHRNHLESKNKANTIIILRLIRCCFSIFQLGLAVYNDEKNKQHVFMLMFFIKMIILIIVRRQHEGQEQS